MYVYADVRRENIATFFVLRIFRNTHSVCLFNTSCPFRHHCELAFSRNADCQVLRVCRVLRDHPTHNHSVRPVTPMSTPHDEPPSTPKAPRIYVEPEGRIYPSPAAQGKPHTPQLQRSTQADDSDLRLILARHSQVQPLPKYQETTRDPASPEREEQWIHDPLSPSTRGGWENPKPRNQETTKHPAPSMTYTPQTAPRHER